MPDIAFGHSAYRRDHGRLPEIKLENMIVEKTQTAKGGVAIISRRRLVETAVRGIGPINGIFTRAGTIGGAVFTVSGSDFYRGDIYIGSIAGSGPVSWAASATEVVVTRGASAYSYNGTDLARIVFPDNAPVTAVTFIAGLFVFARANSHKYYWSVVLNARTINALDFASAESMPDLLLDVLAVADSLVLCGQETIETWVPTGEVALPFSRVVQRLYSKGVAATGSAAEVDNTLMFIGNDAIVYRLSDVPQRISDHGIEERITASATASLFSYIHEGHTMTVVRLGEGSWAYDSSTGQWCKLTSRDHVNWRARCATMQGDVPLFGDSASGTVWKFGEWDQAGEDVTFIWTAVFPAEGPVVVNTLDVEAEIGWTPAEEGEAADPIIEMRASRDAGATFSAWRTEKLGRQGEFRSRVRYRRAGMFDPPGGLFEFRVYHPVSCRVTRVAINDPGGGRGR